jgi:8-oxo-dGTP pyrophosphatase MutT (NUDIX family)
MSQSQPPSEVIERRAARVLVVDAAGRVLMLRGFDPENPAVRYWFTVGGGLEPSESTAQAAARELAEETGLRIDAEALGEPVWTDVTEFPFDGRRYRQDQVWYLVRVDSWEVDRSGFDEIERATVDAVAWWAPQDFQAATDPYYPPDLPALLHRLGVA